MKVAITGVGGAVGQSIMKALTLSSLPLEVYAVDVHPYSAGLYRSDHSAVLPRPEQTGGLDTWADWLTKNEIDALIPGSDYDLIPFSKVRDDWETLGICQILISDSSLVEICRDKAKTSEALGKAGIPSPASAWDLSPVQAVAWARNNGYPVVIKQRDGSASRNVQTAHDEEELQFYFNRIPNPMLQEYLSVNGEIDEYTCAVFVDRNGMPIGTFSARRDLSAGSTYRAEVGKWPEIDDLLLEIGRTLKPRGVLNIQLRQTNRGPVPFELNIRCSGTTAIRSYFGYNEPEMLVRHYVLQQTIETPAHRTGYAMRYWNEVFLEHYPSEIEGEIPNTTKGTVMSWP